MKDKEFITPYGLFTTIVVTIVGVGIFSYPRELAADVGTDGWIATIVSGIISYLLIYIAYKAIKNNDYNKFYNIVENNFGKIIGFILALIFIIYSIFSISIGMRVFIEVIKMYLLEKTPTEFLLLITILVGSYLIRGEINTLVKFNEISFWAMFVPIILILLCTLNRTDFTNIFPILNNNPYDYIKTIRTSMFSFGGIQIIYMILPFMKDKKKISKTALKSIAFVTLFYVIIVIFTLAVFTKSQTKILLWPTITMIKSISIPGAFIERWEGVVMALWVIFYFTTFVNGYYLCADIVKDMFRLSDIKLSSVLIVPFIYLIALYPENIAELYDINSKVTPSLYLYSLVILPLILILRRPSRKRAIEECD
jgi:spore germination protein (amino acid permease)